jgi:hypothetical protein
VIDGQSDDGTFTDLEAAYGGDARVQLLQNSKSAGFMNTCYEGVDLVKSRWVTFMYDDDVLSPHFIDMVTMLARSSDQFIMGYGSPFPAGDVYPFKPIDAFKRHTARQLFLAYFGRHQDLDFKSLPFSPICCVTTLDLLREWVPEVKRFGSRNSIREHFMLKRNIGPDLMIYLFSLIKHRGDISLTINVMAQFSAHPTSMSVVFGNSDLAVGYWLAKLWAFEYMCRTGRQEEAAICGSALILIGTKLTISRLMRFQTKWSLMMIREILAIVAAVFKGHMLLRALRQGYLYMSEWRRTRTRAALPS